MSRNNAEGPLGGLGIVSGPIDSIIEAANGLLSRLSGSRPGRAYNNLASRLPSIQERELQTPFGMVKTAKIELPQIHPIELDARKREVLRQAAAIDIAQVFGVIPVIGDIVADVIEDTHAERLAQVLEPDEEVAYRRYDKFGPSTVAAARALMGRQK